MKKELFSTVNVLRCRDTYFNILKSILLLFVLLISNNSFSQNFENITITGVSSGGGTNNALFTATSPTIPSLAFVRAQRISGAQIGTFTQNGDNIRYTHGTGGTGIPNNISRIRFTMLQSDGITPVLVNDFRFVINDIDGPDIEALATDCGANVRFTATAIPTNLIINNTPPDLRATGTQNESNGTPSRVMYEFNDVNTIEFDNYANNGYLKDFDMNQNDFPIATPLYAVCLQDSDGDGVTDDLDLDDDNDGILDSVEAGGNDPNGDHDGDGLPNYLDTQDNTGQHPTYIANADGSVTNYTDADGDGVPDVYESSLDSDSIPNHLDFDSDDDGCPDSIEAYGVTSADPDSNSYYGTGNPPATNPNGTVIGASYAAPVNNNGGSNPDYLTPNIISFSGQPVNQSTPTFSNATFTSTVTGSNIVYVWQQSVNGGTSWATVSNGGTNPTYSNATTNALTLTSIPYSYNNYLYRVLITSTSNICTSLTSNNALLTVVNTNPVATGETNTTLEDTTLTVLDGSPQDLLQNDTDADGDTLTITQFVVGTTTYPAGTTANLPEGDLTINADGSYTFVPALDFNGPVPTATYTVSDGNGGTATATLGITVTAVNDVPVATGETNTTPEDITLTVLDGSPQDLLQNDTDADGNTLTITQFVVGTTTYPAGTTANLPEGDLTINANGSYTFVPAPGYNGPVPIATYTVSDGNGGTDTADLDITVTSVNDVPVATGETNSTLEDTTLTVLDGSPQDLLQNDTDADGDTLTITQFVVGTTTYTAGTTANLPEGDLTINADGSYTFVPALDFNGPVPTATYTVSDGNGGTATATLGITVTAVNDVPVATGETNTTPEDTTLTVLDGSPQDLLQNDTDADGNTLTITQFVVGTTTYLAGTTANLPEGDLTINANGSYTFVPAPGYNGPVPTATYTVSDGNGGTDTADLDIIVTSVNDVPVATGETNTTLEDTTLTVLDGSPQDLLQNDTDADGDTLTITQFVVGTTTYPAGTTANLPEGDLTINADGSYTFVPALDFNGPVPTATYTVSDGNGGTATATLGITVTAVNDVPVATGETNTTPEDITLTVLDGSPQDLLQNDTDADGDTLTITQFVVGTTTYPAGTTANLPEGDLTINANGSYTFVPALNYFGPVPMATYTVSDGNGGTDSADLDITVTSVNDVPVATGETNTTLEDTTLTVLDGSPQDLLQNDTDADGDTLTITQFVVGTTTYPAGTTANLPEGDLTINADGSYTFVPALDFNGPVPTATYTVSDGNGGTDTADLNITVIPDNDGDGIPDNVDLDDDNDGIPDLVENGGVDPFADTDGDGTPDYLDTDAPNFVDINGDGVSDIFDNDGDGIIDQFDLDSDNDGITDVTEAGGTDANGDGIIDGFTDVNGDGLDDATAVTPLDNPDTDGDGIPDAFDLDSDNDGIPDVTEAGGIDANGDGIIDGFTDVNGDGLDDATATTPLDNPDTDGDGVNDYLDLDSDNDGITDVTEAGGTDTNGDGIIDGFTDVNGDGLDDTTATTPLDNPDTDGDGIPNNLDLDSDNDGITDVTEAGGTDVDGDGIIDGFTDTNNDGLDDATATTPLDNPDTDGDGINDNLDLDSDNDGITDVTEAGGADTNGDGIIDGFTDVNGDGLDDATATTPLDNPDTDGDGVNDYLDLDSDNDGITDVTEAGGIDANGDGIIDGFTDINNDGLDDATATTPLDNPDTDLDGINDYLDLDADNDGIPDNVEAQSSAGYIAPLGLDTDGDGLDDAYDLDNGGTPIVLEDTDGDNTPDILDLDSDNDGVYDQYETGVVLTGLDSDNDGLDDAVDATVGYDSPFGIFTIPSSTLQDTDGTEDLDYRDIDDDGDGDNTIDENSDPNGDGNPDDAVDSDLDGIPDYLDIPDNDGDGILDSVDLDDDNDGIPDAVENGGVDPFADSDLDGVPDYIDPDAPGFVDINMDGINDVFDTDLDGVINQFDLDGDNDGIPDITEAGGIDVDGDGIVDNMVDVNNDGIDDTIFATPLPTDDADADGLPNYLDLDSDNDGITDLIESGSGAPDANNDGVVDGIDADADGIIDTPQTDTNIGFGGTTTAPVNTDGIGGANYLDQDSDNDGIPDNVEAQTTDGFIYPSGVDANGNGIDDIYETATGNGINPIDFDNDGVPDYQDLDTDNDGIYDQYESGIILSGLDSDGDGLDDAVDLTVGYDQPSGIFIVPGEDLQDTDGTEDVDYRDEDDDGDGTDTADENPDANDDGNPDDSFDSNDNGIPDYLEINNANPDAEDDLEVFTAVSPDGDGQNDVFVIRNIEKYPENTLLIFNRWGVQVYQANGYGQDNKYFRGISEGRETINANQKLPVGTYFYVLKYINESGVGKERAGYLYINE